MLPSITSSLAVLLAVAGFSDAADKTVCSTKYGPKSLKKIPRSNIKTTTTLSITQPWPPASTVSATVTIVPANVTVSVGAAGNVQVNTTSTSFSTKGFVTSITDTQYSYRATVKATDVFTKYTTTRTTTLDASTSTVTTPKGFIPAASILASARASISAGGSGSGSAGSKRNEPRAVKKVTSPKKAKQFPTQVICTIQATKSTTVFPGARPTTTVSISRPVRTVSVTISGTGTFTRTFTVAGTTTAATSTKTLATITAIASFLTQGVTSTTISMASIVTETPAPLGYSYDICKSSNMLDFTVTNDTAQVSVSIDNTGAVQNNPTISRVASAYDCCVSCASNYACDGTFYRNGFCFLLLNSAGQCASKGSANILGTFQYNSDSTGLPGSGLVISNGNCGSWAYGGAS